MKRLAYVIVKAMPVPNTTAAVTELTSALDSAEEIIARSDGTAAEDQLKRPVADFLEAFGSRGSSPIAVYTEQSMRAGDVVAGVRLDLSVRRGSGAVIGHVELKAPDKSANPKKPSGWSPHDKLQWKKLSEHPNLVYSNGREWTLWRQNIKGPVAAATVDDPATLVELIELFLSWKPLVPGTPRALAETLAPLTRLLRDSVDDHLTSLGKNPPARGLAGLYRTWTDLVMPGADHKQFADSFAQVFTYGLLLARIESGHTELMDPASAAEGLDDHGHRLLSSVLLLMSQPSSRKPVEGAIGLLETTIGAVNPAKLADQADLWMYFYEDFLAAYDKVMRKQAGVYYTPVEVVQAQVRLVESALVSRFGLDLSSPDVKVLDPAVGTGPYLMEVARRVTKNSAAPADEAEALSRRLHGFELLVGPYAVAHMRLTQILESSGAALGDEGVNVFLTDTLSDPGVVTGDNEQTSIWEVFDNISEENRRAGLVKSDRTSIRVVIGNPPYERTSRAKALGKVRTLDHRNVVLESTPSNPALLDDFLAPLSAAGGGGHAKNLYNFYVFFWRWAIWKACEQNPRDAGIVSFITASSFLRGPGFAGMREHMRRQFDEVWVIDLGGDNRGARPEPNVFKIETAVCITIGIQRPYTSSGSPIKAADRRKSRAKVYYQRVWGTAVEKLAALSAVVDPAIDPDQWLLVSSGGWGDRFVPSRGTAFELLPELTSVFPWVHSGVEFKRKWPIAPDVDTIERRWEALYPVEMTGRAIDRDAFHESSDLTVDDVKKDLETATPLPALSSRQGYSSAIDPVRYSYRSFDRQYAIPDPRLCGRPRPPLWLTHSDQQLYLATLTTTRIGKGPALTVGAHIPDRHYFRGSYGGRSTMPLWRDNEAVTPNLNSALSATLASTYGRKVTVEEIAYYTYGLLGTGAYTLHFDEDLEESTARVPFTTDLGLFERVAEFGRALVQWATYGERGGRRNAFGAVEPLTLTGTAYIVTATSRVEAEYPGSWAYDAESGCLLIGDVGVIGGVSRAVSEYEVSGMGVVASWLGYRMKTPAGRKISPLDFMAPKSWTFDRELLELLWVIERMVAAEPLAATLIDEVMAGTVLTMKQLGEPTDAEVAEPKPGHTFDWDDEANS